MTRLRVVTLSGDPETEATIAGDLARHPDVELLLRCVDRTELLAAVRAGGLEAVISVGIPGWLDRQTATEAAEARATLIGLSDLPDEVSRLKALGGVILPSDSTADVIAGACATSSGAAAPPPPKPRRVDYGKLIAVWGPKGSPGRSAIALELASIIAGAEPSTLLVDADPYGGDLIQLLGVVDELPTIVWAARMAAKGELDAPSLLMELRRAARTGPVLLPGLPRAELWAEVSEYGWRQVLDVVRTTFKFTLCDVGFCLEPETSSYGNSRQGRNALARLTLAKSDNIVAICRADPVGVRSFVWAFDDLKDLVPVDRVKIVLNRVRPGSGRETRELIQKHVGKKIGIFIPECTADFARAAARGRSVLSRGRPREVAEPLRELASIVGAKLPADGVLSRLRRVSA